MGLGGSSDSMVCTRSMNRASSSDDRRQGGASSRQRRHAQRQRSGHDTWLTAGGNVRSASQPEREPGRHQGHHQIAGRDALCDQRFHFGTAQHPFDMLGMAFAYLRIAQDERIAQQFV
ncbi:Uncharacterised protein [Salmonella enterica subsp. enterica]|uniref:Uncharacterized protein n=1 Tax=Salmonella enterica I TaxID=59201 RepID=A0A379W3H6_SALET|nr:Uncharacterised protein [Salmonella enterica subsp. enterica]